MYTTIKEKVGMLILVMLLICGAVNAQHRRHYCYYPSNRIVTVVLNRTCSIISATDSIERKDWQWLWLT